MRRFVVYATADMRFEIDADNSQSAINNIAEAFKLLNPTDPLANFKFIANSSNAELKTTIIQDWSAEDMEAEKV